MISKTIKMIIGIYGWYIGVDLLVSLFLDKIKYININKDPAFYFAASVLTIIVWTICWGVIFFNSTEQCQTKCFNFKKYNF